MESQTYESGRGHYSSNRKYVALYYDQVPKTLNECHKARHGAFEPLMISFQSSGHCLRCYHQYDGSAYHPRHVAILLSSAITLHVHSASP